MTNEEAKKILNIIPFMLEREYCSDEIEETLDLAIKALKNMPTENEEVIFIDKGAVKARTGRFVVYDAEWLKEHFNTTEAMLYGQPSEDCISREAVIDIINFEDKWLFDANGHNANTKIAFSGLESRVKALPSVSPKQRWIPVSEKLPEVNIHVLAQFYIGGMAECYLAHNYWHIVGGARMTFDEVIAWQPLPQPYMEDSE